MTDALKQVERGEGAWPPATMGDVQPEVRPGGFGCRKRGIDSSAGARRVVRMNVPDASLPSNAITNTRYTWYNFVPKNLGEQFSQQVNRYFLLIACMQLISTITPVHPITTWAPLIIIFALSASLALSDDLKRRARDVEFNMRRVTKLSAAGQYVDIPSKDVRPGDILRVRKNEELPCDLVLLASSEPKGTAYVMTANLDGETDLKLKNAVPSTQALDEAAIAELRGAVVCLPPNADIHTFDSYFVHDANMGSIDSGADLAALEVSAEKTPLTVKHVLWQATHLKTVDWALGLAVYTGMETRVGCNRKPAKLKLAQSDLFLNRSAVLIFSFQLVLVFTFGLYGSIFNMGENQGQRHFYLGWGSEEHWWDIWLFPARYLLLMSYMIPISLKVTLDFAKIYYKFCVGWDMDMYDKEQKVNATASSTTILEDLGQIGYVLTDKTGTLTQNVMKFRKCSVNGVAYGNEATESGALISDPELLNAVAAAKSDDPTMAFFRSMALNHAVVPQKEEEGNATELVYTSASPDEVALVSAARAANAELLSVDDVAVEVCIAGDLERWERLAELPFTSERKRMTVILRHATSGKIMLHTKGADDVIFALAHSGDALRAATEAHVESFAVLGLRTLVFGHREMSTEEWASSKAALDEAAAKVQGRSAAQSAVYVTLEKDLTIVGASAIEDLLQEEVADTIALLRRANIRFWMLTGDKKSTAKTIGETCRLINPGDLLIDIQGTTVEEVRDSLDAAVKQEKPLVYGIILTGKTLGVVLAHFGDLFTDLSLDASSVICCRVSPQQKADVVSLVKATDAITLAIGDGGNDVGMIQVAHVGVGILGKEGLQASRAADYSIGQFKFLQNLCLVHGRLAYHRTTFIANYSYYKSMCVGLVQLFYNFYCAYSGQTLFNSFSLMGYNTLCTGFGVLFFIFDVDVPDKRFCLTNPEFYWSTQYFQNGNFRLFSTFMLRAMFHAAIALFGSVYFLYHAVDQNGYPITRQTLGYCVFSTMLLTLTVQIGLHSNLFNKYHVCFTFIIPLASFFGLAKVYNGYSSKLEGYDVFNQTLSAAWYWTAVPLLTAVSVLPGWVMTFWSNRYNQTDDQKTLQLLRESGEVEAYAFAAARSLPPTSPVQPTFKNICKSQALPRSGGGGQVTKISVGHVKSISPAEGEAP